MKAGTAGDRFQERHVVEVLLNSSKPSNKKTLEMKTNIFVVNVSMQRKF